MEGIISHPRGGIYFVEIKFAREDTEGIRQGTVPCVVVSSDELNATSDKVTVALIATRGKATNIVKVPFLNWNDEENVVLCDQVHTVSKRWLTTKSYGMMPPSIMKEIDRQLCVALHLTKTHIDIGDIAAVVNNIIDAKKEQLKAERNELTTEEVTKIATKLRQEFDDSTPEPVAEKVEEISEEASQSSNKVVSKEVETEQSSEELEQDSEEEVISTEDETEGEGEQSSKKSKTRRSKFFWTEERMREFMHDKETMSISDVATKWGFNSKNNIYVKYSKCKKLLEEKDRRHAED